MLTIYNVSKNKTILTPSKKLFFCHPTEDSKVLDFVAKVMRVNNITSDFVLNHDIDNVYMKNKCVAPEKHIIIEFVQAFLPDVPDLTNYHIMFEKNSKIRMVQVLSKSSYIGFRINKLEITREKHGYCVACVCDYIDFDPPNNFCGNEIAYSS